MEWEAEKIREKICTVREVKCMCMRACVHVRDSIKKKRERESEEKRKVEAESGESNQSTSATRKYAKCENERIALLIYVRYLVLKSHIFNSALKTDDRSISARRSRTNMRDGPNVCHERVYATKVKKQE